MVRLALYAAVSVIVTALAVAHAAATRKQFYTTVIFLTQNKINVVVLGNLCFLMLVSMGSMLKRVFLGSLSRDEVEELVSSSKYAITETCLALTIFREELSHRVLMLFSSLLFIKLFHWLAQLRVEALARLGHMPHATHCRLVSLLMLLAMLDATFTVSISLTLLHTKQASVLLLFGFEYAILLVSVLTTTLKYVIFMVDLRMDGRWQAKSSLLFYLEFTSDLIRLGLYLIFFIIICAYYGLPLHLIRELCVTFYHLRDRIIKFITYRRITANMNERFPDVTPAELANADRTCIICREEMDTAKKLPCNHIFHASCLRTWLERSQSCPTCRADIPLHQRPRTLPPVPPHLQRILDEQQRIRQQQQQQQQQPPPPPAQHQTSQSSSSASSSSASSSVERAASLQQPVAPIIRTQRLFSSLLQPSSSVASASSSSSSSSSSSVSLSSSAAPPAPKSENELPPPLSFQQFIRQHFLPQQLAALSTSPPSTTSSTSNASSMTDLFSTRSSSSSSISSFPVIAAQTLVPPPPLTHLSSSTSFVIPDSTHAANSTTHHQAAQLLLDPGYLDLQRTSTRFLTNYIDLLSLQLQSAHQLLQHHVLMQQQIVALQCKFVHAAASTTATATATSSPPSSSPPSTSPLSCSTSPSCTSSSLAASATSDTLSTNCSVGSNGNSDANAVSSNDGAASKKESETSD